MFPSPTSYCDSVSCFWLQHRPCSEAQEPPQFSSSLKQTWCWVAGSAGGAALWQGPQEVGNCSTQLGQKWKSHCRNIFLTPDKVTSVGSACPSVLVSSWDWELRNKFCTSALSFCLQLWPLVFQKINLQLGYTTSLCLWDKRTCNERIFYR